MKYQKNWKNLEKSCLKSMSVHLPNVQMFLYLNGLMLISWMQALFLLVFFYTEIQSLLEYPNQGWQSHHESSLNPGK